MTRLGGAEPSYRADIDGLRTLAVVPVVLYHAGVPGFSGGFVGVDIFFVISGYLITQLLPADYDRGSFSITNFYERRIRRIFPALATVLIFTLSVGFLILEPEGYARLALSSVYVTLFLSNLFFWRQVDYFDPGVHGEPLIHTWSLAVEEQFYIFYPLALIIFLRNNWPIGRILLALIVLSLVAAAIFVEIKPSATFYLLPTRAWELLVGAYLATDPAGWRKIPGRIQSVLVAAGLALLLLPIALYDDSTTFPGIAAIPPVAGAAILIWSGYQGGGPIHRYLSLAPMVLVGQASYSFYLWHVPLLSFARYLSGGELTLPRALGVCALSLLVALASLRWIERPFRRSSQDRSYRRMAVAIPVTAMSFAAATAVVVYTSDGLPFRLGPAERLIVAASEDRKRHPFSCMSNGDRIVPPSHACILGDRAATPHVLLWGDSHSAVTATAMEHAAQNRRSSFRFVASADCPIGLDFSISEETVRTLTTTPSYKFCDDYNRAMLELARNDPRITTVVLSSRWTNWRIGEPANPTEPELDLRLRDASGTAKSLQENRAIFERGFNLLVLRLTQLGKQVVIVAPVPEPRANVPKALFVEQFGLSPQLSNVSAKAFRDRNAVIERIFDRIGQKYPDVQFIRPSSLLCDDGECALLADGKPAFFDHNHLSVDAAHRTSRLYDPLFIRQQPEITTIASQGGRPTPASSPGVTGRAAVPD